jgi:hypothetical protein
MKSNKYIQKCNKSSQIRAPQAKIQQIRALQAKIQTAPSGRGRRWTSGTAVVGAVVVGDGGGRGSRGLDRLLVRRRFERRQEQPLPPAVIPAATLAVGAGKEGRRHRRPWDLGRGVGIWGSVREQEGRRGAGGGSRAIWLGFLPSVLFIYLVTLGLRVDSNKLWGLFAKMVSTNLQQLLVASDTG